MIAEWIQLRVSWDEGEMISHESFVFTSSTFRFWEKFRTKASFSHVEVAVQCGNEFLLTFLVFGVAHFSCAISFKSFQNRTLLGLGAEIRFWSRFWPGELLSCQRNSFGFCNLVLANCMLRHSCSALLVAQLPTPQLAAPLTVDVLLAARGLLSRLGGHHHDWWRLPHSRQSGTAGKGACQTGWPAKSWLHPFLLPKSINKSLQRKQATVATDNEQTNICPCGSCAPTRAVTCSTSVSPLRDLFTFHFGSSLKWMRVKSATAQRCFFGCAHPRYNGQTLDWPGSSPGTSWGLTSDSSNQLVTWLLLALHHLILLWRFYRPRLGFQLLFGFIFSFTFGIAFAGGATGGAALEDAAPNAVAGGIDGMVFTRVLLFTSLNGLLEAKCGDNGMQWCNEQFCNAMRTDEMRKGPTLKRDGTGMKVKRFLLRSTEGLPAPYRHILGSAL